MTTPDTLCSQGWRWLSGGGGTEQSKDLMADGFGRRVEVRRVWALCSVSVYAEL